MKRCMTVALMVALTTIVPHATARAQGGGTPQRAYTEGEVTVVTFIRTKPGMFDKYMEYLQSTYKKQMEAEKAAGIVVRYAVETSDPRDANDHDIALIVVYKNMAAFDGLDDKEEAVANRVMGNSSQQRDMQFADRGSMRTVLGSRMYRELVLK